jgi:hypothetical protein
MSLTTNSKKESQSPVQIRRTVHRMDQGAKTTRFVLHPDQVRLAKSIDEMDGKARGAINIHALDTAKSGDITITRELMIIALARFPTGVLVKDLCEEILNEEKSAQGVNEIKQRVYSMLKRETARGTVEPEFGKGNLRKLTPSGMSEAALLIAKAQQIKDKCEQMAKAKARAQRTGTSPMVNSAFDLGRKVEMGVLTGLPAHSFQS